VRIVALNRALTLALSMGIFTATSPADALAEIFQFDYEGYSGGAYEPAYPMKNTLTYYTRDHENFVTHIAFNEGWYSDNDVGKTFIAQDTSLNYAQFLEFLTNGNDEELYLCFGGSNPDHPLANKLPAGGCSPIVESLLFSGCPNPPLYSVCNYITILNGLDRSVTDLEDYTVNEISLDIIEARTYRRYGNYICLQGCTTWESKVRFTFDLTRILEPPEAPEVISSDSQDGSIVLWVSVSDNGGTDITEYEATCTDGTSTFTGTSTSSPITVSGLTNEVAYTCTVTATNSVGTSSASAATAPITPEETSTGLPIWLLYQATQ